MQHVSPKWWNVVILNRSLKGLWHDLSSIFLMSRMVNMDVFNDQSQSQLYIVYMFIYVLYNGISFNLMLLLYVVDKVIYEHMESVYLVLQLFCQRNGIFFTLHYL